MAVLFAGTEIESFLTNLTAQASTSGYFDSTYVRCAMVPAPGEVFATPVFAAQSHLWFHFDLRLFDGTSSTPLYINFIGTDGVAWLRLRNGPDLQLERWNGSAYVSVWTYPSGVPDYTTVHSYDLEIDIPGDVIKLYIDNYVTYHSTADNSAFSDFEKMSVTGGQRTMGAFSQIMVADEITAGWKMFYRPPTGDSVVSGHSAWTGGYVDVDEYLNNYDSDFISSATANQIELMTKGSISIPNGFAVKAVGVSARAKNSASGPQSYQPVIRFGSTDYVGDTITPDLTFGGAPGFYGWAVNPATSLPWVPSDAGSSTLEFGLKSIT